MTNDAQQFPRVLIVTGEGLGERSGHGITLNNIYALWPREQLAQIHTARLTRQPDIQSFHYSERYVPAARIARAVVEHDRMVGLQSRFLRGGGTTTVPIDEQRQGLRETRPTWQRAWLDIAPQRFPPELHVFCREFAPDLVYTPLGFVRVLRLALAVTARTGAPLVSHFMDDWRHSVFLGIVNTLPRRLLHKALDRVAEKAVLGLAISDDMAAEFRARYRTPFLAMGNSVPVAESPAPLSRRDDIRLVYVGGLHLSRWYELERLANALEERTDGMTLDVYTPEIDRRRYAAAFEGLTRTRLRGNVSPEQVADLLVDYDILVHVESFELEAIKYTRLSLSTKIPQYLAVGRPVLAIGPGELGSIRHLARSGGAIVISDERPESLATALDNLENHRSRVELAEAGHCFARRRHDRVLETERMRSAFAKLVDGS